MDIFWNANLTQKTRIKVKLWNGLVVLPVWFMLINSHADKLNPNISQTSMIMYLIGGFLIISSWCIRDIVFYASIFPKHLKNLDNKEITEECLNKIKQEQRLLFIKSGNNKKLLGSIGLLGVILIILSKFFR